MAEDDEVTGGPGAPAAGPELSPSTPAVTLPARSRVTVTLPAEPASAREARRVLGEVLHDAGLAELVDSAELACTELVTNALLHAHTRVELTIEVGDGLRVEVRDFSVTMPAQRGYDPHATTGRGLALVAALSDAHGIADAGVDGKVVWFTLGTAAGRDTEPDMDPLAAWDTASWDDAVWEGAELTTTPEAVEPAPDEVRTVRLLGLPPTLWLAARQHHDALVRELVLYLAWHPVAGADVVATDQARALISVAVVAAVNEARRSGTARPAVPVGHPSTLPWVPPPLDLEIEVPVGMGPAFAAIQDTLDLAERLASTGRLLAHPGLLEVIAVRDWVCEQVVAQLAGVAPDPWRGTDHASFDAPGDEGYHSGYHQGHATDGGADPTGDASDADLVQLRASVRVSDRGLVAADEANRIVAASSRMAELTGWTVDELVGRRVVVLIPPRLREAHVAGFTRHLTTGEAHVLGVPLVLPVLRKDGSEVMCTFMIEQAPARGRRALYLAHIERAVPAEPGRAPLAVDHAALFRALPTPYLVMSPELVIVDANQAYLDSVGRSLEEIVGRPVFEAFPPTADALDEDGVSRVQRSFERARDTGRPDPMPIQRYDIPDTERGGVSQRVWSLTSIPVLDATGRTVLVAQRAEDITDYVHARAGLEGGSASTGFGPGSLSAAGTSIGSSAGSSDEAGGDDHAAPGHHVAEPDLRRRVEAVEADLFTRAQELAAALESKQETARRFAVLAEGAVALTSAGTLEDLERAVVGRALRAIGADGGMVVTPHTDGRWRFAASGSLPGDESVPLGYLPADSPFPGCWVARTGRRLLLPTRAAGIAFDEVMAEVYENTRRSGWAFVPLRVNDQLIGSLAVTWTDEHHLTSDELELLDALAAQLSQALERIRATEARAEAAAEAERLSEALQRSMLTDPPQSEALRIAVRYQPAATEAKVGGDWYDAFVTATGSTALVVGDVNGHDRAAAALMGQVRNMLRAIAYDDDASPAMLLSRLDVTLQGLALDTLATAVLARVEPGRPGGSALRLRWSSAGHLPPVLRHPDGRVEVLNRPGDLLLGLDARAPRSEHLVDLEPGSIVVLYTDGLVERRGASLDEGVATLVRIAGESTGECPETLADAIVGELGPQSRDDDLALLVLRVAGPED